MPESVEASWRGAPTIQARRFGAEIVAVQDACALEARGPARVVRLAGGGELSAHSVLIATGVAYRRLEAPGLERLTGRGVYYGAALAEAQGVTGQDVYLVGGANSAGRAAVHFARFAAALHGIAELRVAMHQLQNVVSWMASADLGPAQLRELLALQRDAASTPPPTARGGLELGNAEDEICTWLDEHDVDNAWSLASTFVSAGVDQAWLEGASRVLGTAELSPCLNWIAATLLATNLLDQADDAVTRISQLVAAVKEYSYMDRAPEQEVNVHEGIDKTLLVLAHKIGPGIQIVREYDQRLPSIQANGAELNQVWTNLIDNAIDAMHGNGQVLIRTRQESNAVVVEIGDQGPGIPPELASWIFDPFFTTKDVGKGTGLGLDTVRQIVVDRHHGDIRVESTPGDTRFIVRLPAGRAPGSSGSHR